MLTCIDIINKRKQLWDRDHDIELDKQYTEAVAVELLKNENLRLEIKNNAEYMIEMFFVIVNKNQETVPFFLNTVQKIFLEKLNKAIADHREGKRHHLKFLVLKGRQQGFTSVITAYQEAKTITTRNFSGFTVADNGDNTNTIFEDKAKYPYGQLPDIIKPSEKFNTRKELIFDKLNSKWRIATAGNKDIGRSKTINFFHGSEAAFWDSISTITSGLGQALTKDSITILETTANGFNEYRTLWRDAERGENNYEPLFFEWWLTPEYRLEFESKGVEAAFIERVEKQTTEFDKKLYRLKYNQKLEWTQLYWYSAKERDLREKLPQEYPCTPLEAFLSSGLPVFDNEVVLKRIDELEALYRGRKLIRGFFKYDLNDADKIVNESIQFVPTESGELIIYEQPKKNYPYVLGGDTAEGGKDYCVGQIINNNTSEQIAKWRGRTDTDLFAKQMYCLGMYYNKALIGIEANFDSHPMKELVRLEYPNIYYRQLIERVDEKPDITKAGFNTNLATRPVILGDLVMLVRESVELINDIDTLNEMLVFNKNEETGRPEAAEGEHDDCVMSLAITYKIRSQQRYSVLVEEVEKPKKLADTLGIKKNTR